MLSPAGPPRPESFEGDYSMEEKIERKKAGRFSNVFKKVVFYLAETKTKIIQLSHVHLDYRWLCYADALKRITYKNAKDVLEKANKHLKSIT